MFPLGHVGLPLLLVYEGLRGRALDLRLVALGGLLPDLLDKGVLWLLGSGTAKALGHTLLFTVALLVAARVAPAPWRLACLALGIGTASHLVLDAMWVEYDALLWPLFGWAFPSYPYEPGAAALALVRDPATLAGEVAGAAALAWIAWRAGPGAARAFVRTGRLPRR